MLAWMRKFKKKNSMYSLIAWPLFAFIGFQNDINIRVRISDYAKSLT